MIVFALVLLVRWRTGSDVLSGAVVAAYMVPSIVSGPLLGAWLDRTRRPLLALAGNQFVLALVALGFTQAEPLWLPVLAFVAGLTLPLTSGGFTSMLPRLDTDLPKVTAYDSMLFSAAAIGGPALSGVLAHAFSPAAAMLTISVLSAAGALSTLTMRLQPSLESPHSSLGTALRAGARHLVSTPPLLAATVTSVLSHAGIGMLAIALPAHVTTFGIRDTQAGIVWAVIDIGCVLSLLLLRSHLSRWRPERILFVTVVLYGISVTAWPVAPSFPVLLGLALLSGAVMGPTLTSLITVRQQYSPAELLGQVSTSGASLKIGAFALGAAVAGPMMSFGSTAVVLVVAGCQVVATTAGLAVSTRTVRTSAAAPLHTDLPGEITSLADQALSETRTVGGIPSSSSYPRTSHTGMG